MCARCYACHEICSCKWYPKCIDGTGTQNLHPNVKYEQYQFQVERKPV